MVARNNYHRQSSDGSCDGERGLNKFTYATATQVVSEGPKENLLVTDHLGLLGRRLVMKLNDFEALLCKAKPFGWNRAIIDEVPRTW